MTQNQIAWFKAREEARHNVTVEEETRRSNLANEQHARDILRETNRNNIVLSNEVNRSNTARERETFRSNVAREAENRRHNQATENVSLLVNQNNVAQQRYQTQMSYMLGMSQLHETARSHLANEGIAAQSYRASVSEQSRHNQATEALTRYSNTTQRNLANAQAVNYSASANLSNVNAARILYLTPAELESYKVRSALTQQQARLTETQADLYPLEVESQLLGNTAKTIGVIYKGGH